MTTMTTKTTPTTGLTDRVRELLEKGRPKDALLLIEHAGQKSPWTENARGVCLLRTGRADHALALFRNLVFPGGSFTIDDEAPVVFRTNYVTALLMTDNVVTARSLLDEIHDRSHPAVARLRGAIDRWKKSLGLWHRGLLVVGSYPDKPVTLDFPPGDL